MIYVSFFFGRGVHAIVQQRPISSPVRSFEVASVRCQAGAPVPVAGSSASGRLQDNSTVGWGRATQSAFPVTCSNEA